MNVPLLNLCRLCLFKSELIGEDENYIGSSQEISQIIDKIFAGKVRTSNRLRKKIIFAMAKYSFVVPIPFSR